MTKEATQDQKYKVVVLRYSDPEELGCITYLVPLLVLRGVCQLFGETISTFAPQGVDYSRAKEIAAAQEDAGRYVGKHGHMLYEALVRKVNKK